jgi:hypothetical protein
MKDENNSIFFNEICNIVYRPVFLDNIVSDSYSGCFLRSYYKAKKKKSYFVVTLGRYSLKTLEANYAKGPKI